MIGGFWHIATDWAEYADRIEDVIGGDPDWVGGRIPRPLDRPVTKYERRGISAGRQPTDLWFERISP